jgi:hypothetical protein
MALFEVSYDVIAPVDRHPCGARVIGVAALNHIDASDLVRKSYGPDYAAAIVIRGISTLHPPTGDRVWHYLAPEWREQRSQARQPATGELRTLMERLLRIR